MTRQNTDRHGAKIGLKLTAADRKLPAEGPICLLPKYERLIQQSPPSEPLLLTVDKLET